MPHFQTLFIVFQYFFPNFLLNDLFSNKWYVYSLLHLMHAIACAHANTLTTSMICVKNSMCHFCFSVYDFYCLGHWNEGNERKIKNIKLNDYREYYSQFGMYQTFSCIPLRTTAKWLKQSRGLFVFCKNSQQLKAVNFFVKHSILDVWQNSEYASVICYSLFQKIENVNKFNLDAM